MISRAVEPATMKVWLVVAVALAAPSSRSAPRAADERAAEARALELAADLKARAEKSGGAELTLQISIPSISTTQVRYASTHVQSSVECVNTTTAPVYWVASDATDTTNGKGPYCTTCDAGPVMRSPTARTYARASAGTGTLQCGFLDGGAVHSAGGGGVSLGAADARYVKQDGSTTITAPQGFTRGDTCSAPSIFDAANVDHGINFKVNQTDFCVNNVAKLALTSTGIGVNDATPDHVVDVEAGTLGALSALSLTGTIDASTSHGLNVVFATSGNDATERTGTLLHLNAGYTGSAFTRGTLSFNQVAGTLAQGFTRTTFYGGNLAGVDVTSSTTAGHNIGKLMVAEGSSTMNVGGYGRVAQDATTGPGIGLAGVAMQGADTDVPVRIGGFFGVRRGSVASSFAVPTVSAAIIADNGNTGHPIALFRDNSTTVGRILDGGGFSSEGVAIDFTTAGNEDLMLDPGSGSGTGSVVIISEDNVTQFGASDGTVAGELATVAAATEIVLRNGSGSTQGGALRMRSNALAIGFVENRNATSTVGGFADGIAAGASTALVDVLGEGKLVISDRDAFTCTDSGTGAPGALNLDPLSSVGYITNADPHGCVVTIQETSAAAGSDVTLVVVSNAGGVVTFPDSAGVSDVPTACSTTGLPVNGVLVMHYASTLNMYVGIACTDNAAVPAMLVEVATAASERPWLAGGAVLALALLAALARRRRVEAAYWEARVERVESIIANRDDRGA